jgi:hypothetical protein
MYGSSRPPRIPSKFPESVHKRLNAYALAAGAAGVGVLALANSAEAKIIYTPAHVKLTSSCGCLLDLNHDGIADFAFSIGYSTGRGSFTTAGFAVGGIPGQSLNRIVATDASKSNRELARALKPGVQVGPKHLAASFAWLVFEEHGTQGTHIRTGHWIDVRDRYLGLAFQIDGKTHYGWARLNVKVKKSYPMFEAVLTGYAYETIANKPIITGKTKGPEEATPETGTLGAFARGAK